MSNQRMGIWKTLGLIVALVIGIVLISHPGIRKMQKEDKARICADNLALLEVAKARYAIDHNLMDGASCTIDDLVADGNVIKVPLICPSGGEYTVGALGVTPTCSIGGAHKLPTRRGAAVDAGEDLIK